MAPTTRQATKTKHKPGTTNVGDAVLDLVIPYIDDVEDRNSLSLVSRNSYETDGITRKRLTVHTLYYPNPASLSKRFPFIESLTLQGPPTSYYDRDDCGIQITPWIQQLALEFSYLKELHICGLVVHDKDLETLATTRGKDLRSLKIKKCIRFSTHGLMHVSKYCNKLKTFCLENYYSIEVKDRIWLHQLALNSTVLERFHVRNIDFFKNAQELTLLAKTCSKSLISLKIGKCYLSKLGDAFRYAIRLEHFGGNNCDVVGFEFPQNMCSISIDDLPVTQYSIVLPLVNHIRKLKLAYPSGFGCECQCLFFERCPNLEVLFTQDVCGDRGLQVIGNNCKKLRKITHKEGVIQNDLNGLVTHVGLIALAKGCTYLESLKVSLGDISNEALECLGTHLKNLRKFRMKLVKKDRKTDLLLDNGILAMLTGCRKLKSLEISLCNGGLTDVALDYIGKYGANLKSLSLTRVGNSNEGLVKLSEGCPRLRKLKLRDCPYREQAVVSIVFNMPSLRYVWFDSCDRIPFALTRPEFQL